MVSRHHCRLDIDPPHISVRDLGSRNGTYINGRLIGLRGDDEPPVAVPAIVADLIFSSHDLKNGDVLSVGPISFAVKVTGVKTANESVKTASDTGVADAEECTKERPNSMLLAI
jgi:pSer/pThr/pTyr-binding forkhead associated (FHA) protein